MIKPAPRLRGRGKGSGLRKPFAADDRADNIAAAALSWQTHHFTGPQGWADRLVAAGLLSREEAA